MPYSTAQNITGKKFFDQIAVKIKDNNDVEDIGSELVNKLSRFSGNSQYQANNMAKQKEALDNLLNIVTIILSSIGAVSLLVASLSIMTVMLVSVNERTREIGIKKALGARTKDVLFQFLIESATLSAIGGIVGTITGIGLVMIGGSFISIPVVVNPASIILAVVFAMVIGIFFGYYPAKKAANSDPIEALRYE